jgi:hypothetical protein
MYAGACTALCDTGEFDTAFAAARSYNIISAWTASIAATPVWLTMTAQPRFTTTRVMCVYPIHMAYSRIHATQWVNCCGSLECVLSCMHTRRAISSANRLPIAAVMATKGQAIVKSRCRVPTKNQEGLLSHVHTRI